MIKLNEQMLEMLKSGWTSNGDAFYELGTMKLSTRVSEFRKSGIPIETRKVKRKNRFGNTIYFNEYRIKEENKWSAVTNC